MRKSIIIALSILGGLVIVLALMLVFVLGRNSKPDPVSVITTPPIIVSEMPTPPAVLTTAPTSPTPKASTKTVYVQPKITRNDLTRCQQMYRDGYSYTAAYQQWVFAGYPVSWDVDHDGYPCEQSFGNMN